MAENRILVVDDDRTTAKVVELKLQNMGYVVVGIANSAVDAIDKAESTAPDLVLMDIMLGEGMDGIDAAGIIMQNFHIPVIFLTAHSNEKILSRALATNPMGYVNKPLREKDLRTTITLAFDQIRNRDKPAAGANGGLNNLWQFQITSDGNGVIKQLRPAVRERLKTMGFNSIDQLLPEGHRRNVQACVNSRKSQLVTEKFGSTILSFQYHPAKRGKSVQIKVTYSRLDEAADKEMIQQTVLLEALDHLATGIVLINENLKIYYTNKSALNLLENSIGLASKDGYLNCCNPEYTSGLQKTVLEGKDDTMTINRGGNIRPLHILITPLQNHKENYGRNLPTTMVFAFESLNNTERVEDVLRSLYNLSPSESKIAARLVLTPNLEQVAESLGITHNTARTHLKHIYSKTQTNRLSTLLHLIVTGPVGVILQAAA